MEIKHRLIAEVLKLWRADPEERALAEAVLFMTGLHLSELQKLSLQEVESVLRNVIRRPEEKVQQEQKQSQTDNTQSKEEYSSESQEKDVEQPNQEDRLQEEKIETEIRLTELPKEELLQELNKRRGRKPKNEQIN